MFAKIFYEFKNGISLVLSIMNRIKIFSFLEKNEVWLFGSLVLLNLIPLFAGSFFPTLDGPAHLYNSKLILELIQGAPDVVNQFYQLNELVPNLSGHAIIAVLLKVLPPHVAEKTFLIVYAVSLPLSFRYLLKSTLSANVVFSYFILPFVYSYLFLLGFYNFSISLIFLFLCLGFWLRSSRDKFSFGSFMILSLLSFLTFSSHLVIYGLLVAFFFLQIAITWLRHLANHPVKKRILTGEMLNLVAIVFITNLVPLFFTAVYFFKRPQTGNNYSFISWKERITYFTDFRPLIAFNYELERGYTKLLFFVFAILILAVIALKVKENFKPNRTNLTSQGILLKFTSHSSALAATACIVCILAFFILPDSDGYGGYISVRMAMLFLIFLIYWFATVISKKWIPTICIPVIVYVVVNLNMYYSEVIKSLDPVAQEIVDISEQLEPRSVIMPINASSNWLYGHYSNYLGIKEPMVILENYEANSGYFPVTWNEKRKEVNIPHGKLNKCDMIYPLSDDSNAMSIDYIFILGSFSNLNPDCQKSLSQYGDRYVKVYESSTGVLFRINGLKP